MESAGWAALAMAGAYVHGDDDAGRETVCGFDRLLEREMGKVLDVPNEIE